MVLVRFDRVAFVVEADDLGHALETLRDPANRHIVGELPPGEPWACGLGNVVRVSGPGISSVDIEAVG